MQKNQDSCSLEQRTPGQRSKVFETYNAALNIISGNNVTPWAVASGPRGWYIVHRVTGASKFVGPVRLRGKNYCDAARDLALARNAKVNP